MPRGKYTNHKGRNRRFTNPEELEEQRRKDEQEKKWRRNRDEESSEDEDEEDEDGGPSGDKASKTPKTIKEGSGSSDGSSDSDSEDSDEAGKAKGVSNLIQIENPNRVQKKTKKVTTLNAEASGKPELSRREREEIERQRAQAHYQKLHAEGKTDQARADLARLAIIKQQREEAAKRRDAEKKMKEDAAKAKTAQTQKALGKK